MAAKPKTSQSRTPGDAERQAAVDELTLTTALLYFRMRKAAEEMLDDGAQSAGRRSILKSLSSSGPQTVPQMARLRAVSRQHIQKLVNGLMADELVELIENPAHKRSRLVRITNAGKTVAEATAEREASILPELSRGIALDDIQTATSVLKRLKAAFEGDRWQELVKRR